jgi:hypothetical protein
LRHTAIQQARLPDPFGHLVVKALGPGQHHPFALAAAEVIPHPAVTVGEAMDMPEPHCTHPAVAFPGENHFCLEGKAPRTRDDSGDASPRLTPPVRAAERLTSLDAATDDGAEAQIAVAH